MTGGDAEATLDHIRRLVAKRDRIVQAIADSVDQLGAVLARQAASLSPADKVDIWEEARTWNARGASTVVCTAFGVTPNAMKHLRDNPPARDDSHTLGVYPVGWQPTPAVGVPCVYLLMRAGQVIYVGFSENVRQRLRSHWGADDPKRAYGMDRWEVIACRSRQAAWDLEGSLIFQHQPRFNTAGRQSRRYA